MTGDNWQSWKEEEQSSFIYQVQRGRLGRNVGLKNGFSRINNYIHGTQIGRYYLLAADSGVGKTTVTDYMIIEGWLDAKANNKPIKIFYCSFEVSRLDKEAKWCSHFIARKHGISIPTDYILGRVKNNYLSDEELQYVKEGYESVKEMMKDVVLLEDAVHPTAIFESIISNHFEKHGEVKRAPVPDADKRKNRKGRVIGYTQKTEGLITFLVIDHLALLHTEMGLTLKQTMDKMSRYGVILKNMFYCTNFFIQQFSTDLLQSRREAVARNGNKGAVSLTPNRLDLGDSKATFRDCDYCIGLMRPLDYDIQEYNGFNCDKVSQGGLGSFFIVMFLMKNKFGPDGKMCPVFLNYIAGIAHDLPIELGQIDAWLDEAVKLEEVCQVYSPKEN